ncbi:MAG TPA: cytochrome P450 [Candidatus Dormibacteraeota bacterium]|nr:cytochrome P450 [Candidatus Dormibacteraeota bacterium]
MTKEIRVSELSFPRTFGDAASPDPYPGFARFRESGPVHYAEVVDGFHAWVVADFENVQRVLTDPERLSSDPKHAPRAWLDEFGLMRDAGGGHVMPENMLWSDPPVHTRLRSIVSREFTPTRVNGLRPYVTRIAGEILDRLAPQGRAELVYDFALQVPLTVICELFGVPEADRIEFQTWSNEVMVGRPVAPEQVEQAQWRIFGYLAQLIESKREQPGDDLLSALVQVHDDGLGQLDHVELVSMAALLLIAGQETAGNVIGNGILELLRRPERLAQLRADPGLVPAAVDEFLRLVSPALGTWRFTLHDVEIGGTVIPAGEAVLPLIASANRDSARFDRPDEYDPTRPRGHHLAFGHGIHFCIGAALGRMEAEIAIGEVVRRLPGLALAAPIEELRWRPSLMRGLLELPVTFDPS